MKIKIPPFEISYRYKKGSVVAVFKDKYKITANNFINKDYLTEELIVMTKMYLKKQFKMMEMVLESKDFIIKKIVEEIGNKRKLRK